ncbi:hypothetical protein FIBSPDRAFT_903955 [Athelia psychrophila]|uniref:Uncharacterized protein n=1 Tax=Athelia psychrophila TaxID=1759441 RepID=A0A167VCP5_9AGAM|nr:hypothetical protein FIBSPDRAFT_903955 [Fibularhizoctonia sp. CBS 109695]
MRRAPSGLGSECTRTQGQRWRNPKGAERESLGGAARFQSTASTASARLAASTLEAGVRLCERADRFWGGVHVEPSRAWGDGRFPKPAWALMFGVVRGYCVRVRVELTKWVPFPQGHGVDPVGSSTRGAGGLTVRRNLLKVCRPSMSIGAWAGWRFTEDISEKTPITDIFVNGRPQGQFEPPRLEKLKGLYSAAGLDSLAWPLQRL